MSGLYLLDTCLPVADALPPRRMILSISLFVPKPSTRPGCQVRRTPDLGRGVHRCPPASVVGRGGSYGPENRTPAGRAAAPGGAQRSRVEWAVWVRLLGCLLRRGRVRVRGCGRG